MRFTDSPTELTTALTDILLAVVAFGCAGWLLRHRAADPWKVYLWTAAFVLLAVAGLLGAVVHGVELGKGMHARLWQPLHLALGLTVAVFATGAVTDRWGRSAGRRCLPMLLAAGVAFFAVTQFVEGSFGVFILYEAAAMLFALGVYLSLVPRGLPGAWWMVAGVLLSIAAAAVQASPARLTLVWEFDHNGLFHLIQVPGLLALAAGIDAGAKPQAHVSPSE